MTDYPPIKVSDEARLALAQFIRKTSGLAQATLVLGPPVGSPFASFYRAGNGGNGEFTANPDRLVLNPNKVYLTVTPFRMRQEAVMTGALLHEASHARHTKWTPTTKDEVPGGTNALVHGQAHLLHIPQDDGTTEVRPMPVSKQTLALAKLMEEPRIEGIMSVEADSVGAFSLGWTMRASAAHLVPTTSLTATQVDPGQRLMDLITSWALRAGRQLSLHHHNPDYVPPTWVYDFGNLLHGELTKHEVTENGNTKMLGPIQANVVKRLLTTMACTGVAADTGTFMVDTARDVLVILFPETTGDEDGAPMPGDPMHSPEDEESGEPKPMPGEGDPEQGGEDATGSDESDDEGEGEGQGQGKGDSPGDGQSDSKSGSQGDTPAEGAGQGQSEQDDATAAILASIEAEADSDTADEAEAKAAEAPPVEPTNLPGAGNGQDNRDKGWRDPEPNEREVARGAERFLRDLINPTEVSKTTLAEAPSASVDGQALAVWKAGGQRTDPMFFRRTRRTITPAPPVKIAVLVDVSQSMSVLQKPSALLSWALASAAIDLRNFAGRGVQVESTLIHWGTSARVIQANGAGLPGIREVPCYDGTSAMAEALGLVDRQMPGFFDPSGKPEHRLLVQFTDWELYRGVDAEVTDYISRALTTGVNMLSVVPSAYSGRRGGKVHDATVAAAKVQRGRTSVLKYDPKQFAEPADVWSAAKALLS